MFCRNCGAEIKDGGQFCPECGFPIKKVSAMTEMSQIDRSKTAKKEGKSGWKKIFSYNVYCITALILAMATILLVFINKKSTEYIESKQEMGDIVKISDETGILPSQTSTEEYTNIPESEISNEISDSDKHVNENIQTDYSQWEDNYQRDFGPASSVWIVSMDDNGIMFTVSIGVSGYAAYVDMREAYAEWVNEDTAVYKESGYELSILLNDDGTLTFEDNQPCYGNLSLSGIYRKETEANFPDCEYVFPDSAYSYLSYSECEGLSALECKIARNEIYARHGRRFTDESLQAYFDACSWYNGTIEANDFSESVLNEYEMENLNQLIEYEKSMGYR